MSRILLPPTETFFDDATAFVTTYKDDRVADPKAVHLPVNRGPSTSHCFATRGNAPHVARQFRLSPARNDSNLAVNRPPAESPRRRGKSVMFKRTPVWLKTAAYAFRGGFLIRPFLIVVALGTASASVLA